VHHVSVSCTTGRQGLADQEGGPPSYGGIVTRRLNLPGDEEERGDVRMVRVSDAGNFPA